jgi:hypothetical protein
VSKLLYFFALTLGVPLFAGVTSAQYPNVTADQVAALLARRRQIVSGIADKVVQKYQNSTCEQLRQKSRQPKSQWEKEAIQLLHGDQQMRAAFLNLVARPVANKMLECGLIPTPDLGRPTTFHTTVQTVGPSHPPP